MHPPRLRPGQKIIQQAVAVTPIIIVRIDDGKRPLDHVAAAQHRMTGTPRLYPSLRHRVASRQLIQLLVHILHRHMPGDPVADVLAERFLDGVLDDKHHLAKPGRHRVIN